MNNILKVLSRLKFTFLQKQKKKKITLTANKNKKKSSYDSTEVYQTCVANVEIHRCTMEVVVDHLVDSSLASVSRTKPEHKMCKC